jgi:FtsP/CotA-like multicopper oxidase with cupredoxin domain
MNRLSFFRRNAWAVGILAAIWLLCVTSVHAQIQGITGTTFNLTATTGNVVTSDGDSFQFWGYAEPTFNNGAMSYPGPTLIVNEGDVVTVNLTNGLPAVAGNTSIVFPGHVVSATGGVAGVLAQEAAASGGSVTYTFTATHPGTYSYRSGSNADLQVEMGLVGAIIVRPVGYVAGDPTTWTAYGHADTAYDREFLLVVTEMNPNIHRFTELGLMDRVDTSDNKATNWFANGRNFPDNMAEPFVPWLPNQPYNFVPRMHPGEKVLVRSIGSGNDLHPFHYHGNDIEVIAQDGRLLSTGPGNGPDLAWKAATRRTVPGQTADGLWTWAAEKLGWDIYGHEPAVTYARSEINAAWPGNICDNYDADPNDVFDTYTNEYCPDHGVQFPVILPQRDSLTFGDFYAGTPFLGGEGNLTPGDAGLNSTAGYFYMWHSHTEKELTSNDIWPGGMVTFMIVEHPSVVLD